MTALDSPGETQNNYVTWFSRAPWRLFILGIGLALLIAILLMWALMRAPLREITSLAVALSATSLLSLGLGYVLYRRGLARSPSLSLTLILTYAWATVLTLFNVW